MSKTCDKLRTMINEIEKRRVPTSESDGIVRRVWETASTKQLLVTIPKDKGIKKGDYIEITKRKVINLKGKEL
ncbi:MAG: hypothetical protein GW865_00680 [Candidatus Aenigmarchaeota archaeon]|nr:hypothetical protein [Candidatus Aenigmarchaeota archaeon]